MNGLLFKIKNVLTKRLVILFESLAVFVILLILVLFAEKNPETQSYSEIPDKQIADSAESETTAPFGPELEKMAVGADSVLGKTEDTQSIDAQVESDFLEEEEDEYANLAIAQVDHYVNVRTQANTDSEVVGKMYDGAVAEILEEVGEGDDLWFKVVSGSVEGYIKAEFFIYGENIEEKVDDYVTRYAVVHASRLNIRKEPDEEAGRLGYALDGEKLLLVEYGDEWSKVRYSADKEGYVSSDYIVVEESYIYAKSVEEEQQALEAEAELAKREEVSEQEAPEEVEVAENQPAPATYLGNSSDLRNAIVSFAMQYVGGRYVHGGQSLETGTDCSGFTSLVYKEFGYSISRTPGGQCSGDGRNISIEELQPGDIICYSGNGRGCTHVALYIGNNTIVHAANSRRGIVTQDMYYGNIIACKNVID